MAPALPMKTDCGWQLTCLRCGERTVQGPNLSTALVAHRRHRCG